MTVAAPWLSLFRDLIGFAFIVCSVWLFTLAWPPRRRASSFYFWACLLYMFMLTTLFLIDDSATLAGWSHAPIKQFLSGPFHNSV
jgi:UDP-N-acetylmuramyl pentapeptide phosphotransferase/UDP-N-acetylglucosamine-1-phosphate transferase